MGRDCRSAAAHGPCAGADPVISARLTRSAHHVRHHRLHRILRRDPVFLACPPRTFALLTSTQGWLQRRRRRNAGLIVATRCCCGWRWPASRRCWLQSAGLQGGAVRRRGVPGVDRTEAAVLARQRQRLPRSASSRGIRAPGVLHHAAQSKAIVFYMAFFPLFIDPATHRGWPRSRRWPSPSPSSPRCIA